MIEADEAMTGGFDLLHAQVEPFGRSVRGSRSMVVEDLRPPALQGVAERSDLGHLVSMARQPAIALSNSTAATAGSSVR
jgi:hypothetical protein